jgi:hypothetical protein
MHRYGQKKELMEWNAVQEVRGGGDGGGGAGGRGLKGLRTFARQLAIIGKANLWKRIEKKVG